MTRFGRDLFQGARRELSGGGLTTTFKPESFEDGKYKVKVVLKKFEVVGSVQKAGKFPGRWPRNAGLQVSRSSTVDTVTGYVVRFFAFFWPPLQLVINGAFSHVGDAQERSFRS